jgi:hypothetical protein
LFFRCFFFFFEFFYFAPFSVIFRSFPVIFAPFSVIFRSFSLNFRSFSVIFRSFFPNKNRSIPRVVEPLSQASLYTDGLQRDDLARLFRGIAAWLPGDAVWAGFVNVVETVTAVVMFK